LRFEITSVATGVERVIALLPDEDEEPDEEVLDVEDVPEEEPVELEEESWTCWVP